MAYNIIPQRGVFSTIANLINENFQRIYQQILGLDGSGEQAAEDISQLESDVSALQSGKANDADVVHKAGAETITGNKTFTGTVKLPLQNSGILVTDENGVVQSDSNTYAGAQTSGGAANKAVSIPFGQVDSTSTSTAFTATVDGITELRDGVCVYLKNGVVTSAANCTLNVNGLGAKRILYTMAAASAVTTQWNINYTMLFIYNSTRMEGGCWDMYYGYYSDGNYIGYQLRTNSYTLPASDTSRYYKIFFTSADNTKWVPASADSTNNSTSAKPVNQRPINPFGPIVYAHSTANFTTGTNVTATAIWQQYPLTFGYSFNRTGAALTLTIGKPVFIKCAPQDDGGAIIDADVPYVQDLPTTEDGKIYIFLGVAYSATQIELQMVHPVFYYKNGAINLWTGNGTQTDVSKSTESNVIDVAEYDLMKINEVKGKSLVMNQLVQNGAVRTASGVTQSYDSTTGTMILNGTATANANFYGQSHYGAVLSTLPAGHKGLFISSFVSGTFTGAGDSCIAPSSGTDPLYFKNGYATKKQIIISSSSVYPLTNIISGDKFENVVFRQQQIDLTKMFGAGNEPTTVEEVEAIFGNDYYEYNTGEVVGNSVEKLDVYDSNDAKKGSLALNLTELTGKVGERLPAAYTKLEYIESSGSSLQYIDTGISGNNDNLEITCDFLYSSFSAYGGIFGNSAGESDNATRVILTTSSGTVYVNYNSQASAAGSSKTCSKDARHTIVLSKGKISIDGTVFTVNTTSGTTNNNNILLFAAKSNSASYPTVRIYSFSIKENNTLLRNFIPAKRNSDDELGMYDLVSGTFFTNSGTGTFTAGSVVQSVTIFSDGLHGVGDAYDSLIVDDDGYARRAVKRMWSVDLGSLTWLKYTQSEHNRFQATISPTPYASSKVPNIINGYGYYGSSAPYGNNNKDLALMYYSGSIYLRNDIYENSTAEYFKTAMSGVMLYYELATPIEYVLDTPVQCVAKVYPNGTVKQVPVMPDSTPMVMDVTYLHDTGGVIGGLMNRLASLEPRMDDLAKGIKTISVQYGDATSIVLETEKINGNEGTVSIPAATSQAAGAMSAAQAKLLEDLSDLADDIETLLASI